jgi:hypothetical protein
MGWFEFGAEIIAIEDSDWVGWAESATTFGELNFTTLEVFANAVTAELGTRKLALLHIQVHGSPEGIGFGNDWVSNATFDTYRAQLARLSGKFTSDGWLNLRACNVGSNLELLHRFRRLWNVGVVAGRSRQNNLFDMNFGFYQIVTRDGAESQSFSRPPWTEYNATRRLVRGIAS